MKNIRAMRTVHSCPLQRFPQASVLLEHPFLQNIKQDEGVLDGLMESLQLGQAWQEFLDEVDPERNLMAEFRGSYFPRLLLPNATLSRVVTGPSQTAIGNSILRRYSDM